ncbi:MAG: helix-turn-helix domain-containing protein, partial [Nannocystaceae bacterium]|nr:helix-turn-helix domain-containing protein [Nannocystaceae bacterium]
MVGVSRTSFATRFAERVGKGPAAYLRRVRLHEACAHLEDRTLG